MNMIAAQEIKRRGIRAVDDLLEKGPVQIVKNNRARYVVMSEAEFDAMMDDMAEARLVASEADLKAGRFRKGKAADLMAQLRKESISPDQVVVDYLSKEQRALIL